MPATSATAVASASRGSHLLRDLVNEAVQVAVARDPQPTPRQEIRRRLITVDEARNELGGISRTTFYELVKADELGTVKIGRRTFVAASELDAYVSRRIEH
jgi:excisionase family DNA binding protein